ncbi:LLM class flavin-dependent oxidoreductase [Microbacterium sp. NPDC096154]|uniref:LLM class flavin-dependent oxidoreductase n=1 Tax=Microbacterium sp. NPDC096154 TaxID=3155549 RepID=UPI003319A2F1
MRVGVVMWPIEEWPAMGDRWAEAESLGFDTGWVYDHLAWRGHTPWDDAYATLAAAATRTSTMRLGTLVTSPNFRTPIPTASAIRTIDRISQGRLTIGVGAGGASRTSDGEVLGRQFTPRERADRFAEWTREVDLLLRESPASATGEHWSVQEATIAAGLVQRPRPPLWLAANGPRGLRLTAELADGWIANPPDGSDPLADTRDRIRRLEDACTTAGREPAAMRKLLMTGFTAEPWLESADAFADLAGAYAEAGVTDLALHWPRPGTAWDAPRDVFEAIAARAAHL